MNTVKLGFLLLFQCLATVTLGHSLDVSEMTQTVERVLKVHFDSDQIYNLRKISTDIVCKLKEVYAIQKLTEVADDGCNHSKVNRNGFSSVKFSLEENSDDDMLKIDGLLPNILCVFLLIICAGLAAGLTTGLLSIEPLEMVIKQRSGNRDEKRQAGKILPIISKHHFLLVTLLLFNSLANEALPIFLDNILPAYQAVIVSVTLVLFFGEIVPTALFTGPDQLRIASNLTYLVWFLMAFFSPIAWPIAKLLDRLLGKEGFRYYNRAEIAALVEVQQEIAHGDAIHLQEDPLQADEVAILHGVLQAKEKCVKDAMLTMDRVFNLCIDDLLDENCMADLLAAGFSRIPVYEGTDTKNIRGYLQVKKLIVLNPADARHIRSLVLRKPEVVGPNKSLLELLSLFQHSRSHMAIVSPSPKLTLEALRHDLPLEGNARPIGIITMEDIIEEIIQEEIWDESDRPSSWLEARAKDTLIKFARRRVYQRRIGRLPSVVSSNGGLVDQMIRISRQSSLNVTFDKADLEEGAIFQGDKSDDVINAMENSGLLVPLLKSRSSSLEESAVK